MFFGVGSCRGIRVAIHGDILVAGHWEILFAVRRRIKVAICWRIQVAVVDVVLRGFGSTNCPMCGVHRGAKQGICGPDDSHAQCHCGVALGEWQGKGLLLQAVHWGVGATVAAVSKGRRELQGQQIVHDLIGAWHCCLTCRLTCGT
jgi:hypothetical protein